MERRCKWGSLGVGQVWVFWVVGGLGSGCGRARGGRIDELVYLVSVGG